MQNRLLLHQLNRRSLSMYIKHIYKNEKNAKASLTIEIVCKPPAAASAPQKNKLIIVFYKCFD